ncbi:hypothetical protein N7527_008627 [Penicillium freii]|uniref:Mitochondrial intermembrane space import and assembly protein 40 n=1 Tax=Penicillium freii TaxID=48697 RepID=A0A101MHQ8_PENFR|nr:hypothetical protein N7527_008627 [Penicillium freii]KUM60784.1 hypothetical protein ACN42_g6334 [Penicillium freii]
MFDFLLSSIHKQNGEDANPQTLDSITPKIRQERAAEKAQRAESAALEGGVNAQELQEEAGQEAAFNPETGEINWNCPCLGGPCDCFRQYPEVYGAELEDDDETPAAPEVPPTTAEINAASQPEEKQARAKEVNAQMKETGEHPDEDLLIPKAAHDTEEKNQTNKA